MVDRVGEFSAGFDFAVDVLQGDDLTGRKSVDVEYRSTVGAHPMPGAIGGTDARLIAGAFPSCRQQVSGIHCCVGLHKISTALTHHLTDLPSQQRSDGR